MDQTASLAEQGRVINITSPKNSLNKFSVLIVLIILLTTLAGGSFASGFLLGKISVNFEKKNIQKKPIMTTDLKNNYSLLSDLNNKFQVTYPKSWKTSPRTSGGASFSNNEASVDIWLVIDQPLLLGTQQQAELLKTSKIELTINKQKVPATEYSFKSGSFFATAILNAENSKPKVTFLLKSVDLKNYETAKALVQSFTFTN